MMDMMNTTGMPAAAAVNTSGILWLELHCFLGVFAIAGFILFVTWAIKNLSGSTLKSLAIWLLALGIAGSFLTAIPAMAAFRTMVNTWRGGQHECPMTNMPMMERMMDMMMDSGSSSQAEHHPEEGSESTSSAMEMDDSRQMNL
ncbi:MAG: hypothetical protein UY87_C0082G0004 [Candidatus Peribacteria bacterium GW2011_GWC2_54_8]|nr:MAG: hypothetical protein UY87_C0082G0004 [Candidatus Peribacteria bacterium GW2011_GWC2_54_8]